jgi:hypothetical protein
MLRAAMEETERASKVSGGGLKLQK